MPNIDIDIKENDILALSKEIFDTLLIDHTVQDYHEKNQMLERCVNIIWATDNYEDLGPEYAFGKPILPELITGEHGTLIKPRAAKSKEQQTQRSKDMAEVFTPSWVCNAQNNLVDEAWFGRKDVFNTVCENGHTWTATSGPIAFPADAPDADKKALSWKDYVRDTRLEMTCGEAPYLASRYDTVSGEYIPVDQRIGLLDRKLRIVSERIDKSSDWLKWAQEAYKATFGFEWQGDSLLIARETLLMTFIDYYEAKFGEMPKEESLKYIAYIVSWNLWQMDGLKMVIPGTCHEDVVVDLFGEEERTPCKGCQQDNMRLHNGIYALVRDWKKDHEHPKAKVRFVDLLK